MLKAGRVVAVCPGCGEIWGYIVATDDDVESAPVLNGCPSCLRWLYRK